MITLPARIMHAGSARKEIRRDGSENWEPQCSVCVVRIRF